MRRLLVAGAALAVGVGGCGVDQFNQLKQRIEVGSEVAEGYASFGDIDLGSTSWFGLGGDDTLSFAACPELDFEPRTDAAGQIVLWLVDNAQYPDQQVSADQVATICR